MDTREQVLAFFEKCDELKKCKFIMATTKIKDILKCIVNCPDLYNLFSVVTKDFDYPLVKSKCLVSVNDGVFTRSYIVMPQTVGHRLGFVFCLLVEFDKDTINFNDFLRRYFPEDGSYYASYHAFCDTVIKGLKDAVAQVFKEDLEKAEQNAAVPPAPDPKSAMISTIDMLISEEKQYLSSSREVPDSEREGGIAMLTQLSEAVKNCNEELINALVCGYNYFVLYNKCVSEGVEILINELAAFEQVI